MNREIKFRAGDKEEKKFVLYFDLSQNPMIWFDKMKDDYVITQYTGLHDKNGVEIYEGDVVKYEVGCSDGSVYKKIASVKYGEFNCSCCDGVYGGYFDDGDIRECDRYEVIGNVMENPDLLNK